MNELLQALCGRIEALMARREQVIVAIDGCCAAGKTTLAAALAERYDCNVFHMDDFFLRPEQRTQERYAQIGGNVDYERFREAVLIPLKTGKAFSYRPFDCKTFTLKEPVAVTPKKLNIIEGSYSWHPYFEDPYDLRVLMTVPAHIQKERIGLRPAHLHQAFFEKWIPMENRYLEAYFAPLPDNWRIDG